MGAREWKLHPRGFFRGEQTKQPVWEISDGGFGRCHACGGAPCVILETRNGVHESIFLCEKCCKEIGDAFLSGNSRGKKARRLILSY